MDPCGIVILQDNYTYEGHLRNKEPHGIGTFRYAKGDVYRGMCRWGKPDGFGEYSYKSGGKYKGYFSYGRLHGVGTYEDKKNIYKGNWRCDKKHGTFYRTSKIVKKSFVQDWRKGKLIKYKPIDYVEPKSLITTRHAPGRMIKKKEPYKGVGKTCVACCINVPNATNDLCGHVVMCEECLSKCNRCPICRKAMGKIIKLYIS